MVDGGSVVSRGGVVHGSGGSLVDRGGGGLVSRSRGSLVGGGVVLGVLGLTLVLDISDISVLWKDREGYLILNEKT